MKKKKNDPNQLTFNFTLRISPCPYTDICSSFNIGCKGLCYWCKRFDKKNYDTYIDIS